MRNIASLALLALLCLAGACSGGGSDAPAAASAPAAPEPVPSGVLALPGLSGYEIPENTARGALALAEESRELTWADATEDLLVDEVSALIDADMELVAVECRTTWCGMVVDLPIGGDVGISGVISDRLRELFSVNGLARVTIYRPDGTRWIALYVEIRRLV